jgi:hypothetical protein
LAPSGVGRRNGFSGGAMSPDCGGAARGERSPEFGVLPMDERLPFGVGIGAA